MQRHKVTRCEAQQKKPANRKLIYIWDENLEYFNKLPNKSATINQLIKRLRLNG